MAMDNGLCSCKRSTVTLTVVAIVAGVTFFTLFDKSWIQENLLSKKDYVVSLLRENMGWDIKTGSREKCDLFKGRWVKNPSGPSYTNDTCKFIGVDNDCLTNGRPNTEYLYWKWKPYDCELLHLDAKKFMGSMRHKSWAFIGDSILRNQMHSFLCMISKVEEPYITNHDDNYKSVSFYFPVHNITITTFWAPFLVKYDTTPEKEYNVYLDILAENWTSNYTKYDYVVIANGQWYTKVFITWENGKITGCHKCKEGYEEVVIDPPYRKALRLAFDFFLSSNHKPVVFFRTWMPDHFEYGQWFNGGVCNRTRPYEEGEYAGPLFDRVMRNMEVAEFEKVAGVAREKGISFNLLDTFRMSLLRPDGHPGPYRTYHPFDKDRFAKVQNDCLHSCLPGPIDTWNDMMMTILTNEGVLKSSSHGRKSVI